MCREFYGLKYTFRELSTFTLAVCVCVCVCVSYVRTYDTNIIYKLNTHNAFPVL